MRDRITTKDDLVFLVLSQQDLAGIYWMMWEPMMLRGAMAYQYFLEGASKRPGYAPASASGPPTEPDASANGMSRSTISDGGMIHSQSAKKKDRRAAVSL